MQQQQQRGSTVIIQTYSGFVLTGKDMPSFDESMIPKYTQKNKEFVLTPNNNDVVRCEIQPDGKIVFHNYKDTEIRFSISIDNRNVAFVKYVPNLKKLIVNDNWTIETNRVSNMMVHNQSTIRRSRFFHISLKKSDSVQFNQLAFCLNLGSFASMLFSNFELIFICFNGSFASKRLICHIYGVENLRDIDLNNVPVSIQQFVINALIQQPVSNISILPALIQNPVSNASTVPVSNASIVSVSNASILPALIQNSVSNASTVPVLSIISVSNASIVSVSIEQSVKRPKIFEHLKFPIILSDSTDSDSENSVDEIKAVVRYTGFNGSTLTIQQFDLLFKFCVFMRNMNIFSAVLNKYNNEQ